MITEIERAKIERVKAALRAATTPLERIAAANSLEPDEIVLELIAVREFDDERRTG